MELVMRVAFPYILFAVAFLVLSLLYSAASDHAQVSIVTNWLASLVAAAISLLLALRLGRIGYRGLFVATCVLFIAVEVAIFAVLELIAQKTPSHHFALSDMVQVAHTLGWIHLATSLAGLLGAPLLALFLIRRARPALVAV